MPYVEDENGNHITDENGNKLEYTVSYKQTDFVYVNRGPLHINDDGHIDTENRNIVIKDGVNADHVISKGQLDNAKANINELIKTSIQTALNKFSADLRKYMIQFRNQQIRDRVGKKTLKIPKEISVEDSDEEVNE